MRVLLTSDLYKPTINGVVASLLNIEKGLKAQGHEVRILTLSQSMRSYKKDNVYYIGAVPALVYPGARLRTALAHPLVNELIEWHPDVIHSNCEISTFLIARKISKQCRVPIVHTYHTVYEDYTHYFSPSKRLGKAMVRKFSNMVADRTSAFIAPSYKVKRMLESYQISAPIYVIPTGIDQDKFGDSAELPDKEKIKASLGIRSDEVVALYIGRLAKEKNAEELIRYMKDFADDKVKLLFIGDGPYRTALETLAQSQGMLGTKILFYGAVEPAEVGKYYHLGDIFVNASNSETQGLTYFEALSTGLPVLCKQDECLEGVVDQGVNGWTFENEEEFSGYLHAFLDMGEKREEMHEAALKKGEAFSIPAFAESVVGVYNDAIEDYKEHPNRKKPSRVKARAKATIAKVKGTRVGKIASKGAGVAKKGAKKGVGAAKKAARKVKSIRFLP